MPSVWSRPGTRAGGAHADTVLGDDRAAIAAGHWFLWVRCPACRTINAVDLRTLDRHPNAAITSLIPWLSCRSCRPHAPFAELVRLSPQTIADEMREEHRRRTLGDYRAWRAPSLSGPSDDDAAGTARFDEPSRAERIADCDRKGRSYPGSPVGIVQNS